MQHWIEGHCDAQCWRVLQTLVGNDVRLDLPAAVATAAALQPIEAGPEAQVRLCRCSQVMCQQSGPPARPSCTAAANPGNVLRSGLPKQTAESRYPLTASVQHPASFALVWELKLHSMPGIRGKRAWLPDQAAVVDFVTRRLEQLLVDGGCAVEAVKAVLSERGGCPAIAAQSARELQVTCLLLPLYL